MLLSAAKTVSRRAVQRYGCFCTAARSPLPDDIASMSVADLQSAMAARQISTAGCFEKQDLVEALSTWLEANSRHEQAHQREEQLKQEQDQWQEQQVEEADRWNQKSSLEHGEQLTGADKFDQLMKLGFSRQQAIFIDEEGDLTFEEYSTAPERVKMAEELGIKRSTIMNIFGDYPHLFKVDWKENVQRLVVAGLAEEEIRQTCLDGWPLILTDNEVQKVEEFHEVGFGSKEIKRFVDQAKQKHLSNEELRVTVKGRE